MINSLTKTKNISVLILAAGRGERMRPLTDSLPKPLLHVDGKSLLEHHLEKLKANGFKNIVINIDHFGSKITDLLGDGQQLGLNIKYSDERSTGALETAGGIQQALPLLKSESFLVINGDVWSNFDFSKILSQPLRLGTIVLVKNPDHNASGDFAVSPAINGSLNAKAPIKNETTYTFSGIGYYKKVLFDELPKGKNKLAPILFKAAESEQLGALISNDEWFDIGTPQRLEEINELLLKRKNNGHP